MDIIRRLKVIIIKNVISMEKHLPKGILLDVGWISLTKVYFTQKMENF